MLNFLAVTNRGIIFLGILISFLLIFRMMEKIKWGDINKEYLKKLIICSLIISICVSFLLFVIEGVFFGFHLDCWFIQVINWFLWSSSLIVLLLYLLIYKKRGWYSWVTASVAFSISFLPIVSSIFIIPMVNDCKMVTIDEYINESIKGGVFINNTSNNSQNITMIVCNDGNREFKGPIIFYIAFDNNEYKNHVIKRSNVSATTEYGTKWDNTGNPKFVTTNESNSTLLYWEYPPDYLDKKIEGKPSVLFINFSLTYNYSSTFIIPDAYYIKIDINSVQNIAVINDKIKVKNVEGHEIRKDYSETLIQIKDNL